MVQSIVLQNPHNHATGAISTFVFTTSCSTGTDAYDLTPYLNGYRVIGNSFGASAATEFATVSKTSKKVTVASVAEMTVVVHAIKNGGA